MVRLAETLDCIMPTRNDLWKKNERPFTVNQKQFVEHFINIHDQRLTLFIKKVLRLLEVTTHFFISFQLLEFLSPSGYFSVSVSYFCDDVGKENTRFVWNVAYI